MISVPDHSTAPVIALALADAEGQAQAAIAILLDAAAPVRTAVVHLRAGWIAIARVAALRAGASAHSAESSAADPRDVDELDARDADDPAAAIRTHAPTWLSPAAKRAARALTDLAAPPAEGERRAWLSHARALVDVVRAAEAEIHGPARRKNETRTWLRRAGMLVLAIVPIIVVGILFPPDYREGPWRAQYFSSIKFEGDPEIRRDGDLRFNWEDGAPLYDMPEDGFSARWDVCMQVDETLNVRFKLVSDDGSRLFINGETVVDNWGKHAERSRGGKAELVPGIHHLRVEYFEAKSDAMVSLTASLRGERPESIPVKILHYPGDEIDEDDVCAQVRARFRGN